MTDSNSNSFTELPGVALTIARGLPCVRVTTADASGLVFLHGAHVAEWVPSGQDPVLWMSERSFYERGKPLRGGIPICFPWFGPNAEHKEFPAHGFARLRDFSYRGARLDDSGRVELEFGLDSDDATRAFFPHTFAARLRVAFGKTLGLEFSVSNRGAEPFAFEEALHSYFHVADVRQSTVVGLQGSTYTDKVRGLAECAERDPELHFSGETDRVYLSTASCTIRDLAGKRAIRVEKTASEQTVVWNPWSGRAAQMPDFSPEAWPGMLCVESANVGARRISLAPGDTHRLRATVSVSKLER